MRKKHPNEKDNVDYIILVDKPRCKTQKSVNNINTIIQTLKKFSNVYNLYSMNFNWVFYII